MKTIFLISGKACHGKDSVANILKDKLKGNSLIIHNADYLKYVAKQYMGWNGQKDDIGRAILQVLGTEKVRIGLNKPLFWIEKTCDVIDILKNDYDYFFVPDTRFPNEVYYPKARFPTDVLSLRVIRKNFDNGLTQEQKLHPSETALDEFDFDYVIESESGLDKLEIEVQKFIKTLQEDNIDKKHNRL